MKLCAAAVVAVGAFGVAAAEPLLPAQSANIALADRGAGPRSVLALAFAPGTKRRVELAIDAHDLLDGPARHVDTVWPTLVLGGELSITGVDARGTASWQLAIKSATARDVPHAERTAARYAEEAHGLVGVTVLGTVTAHGQIGAVTVRAVPGDRRHDADVGLLAMALKPMWPVLPIQPIAVGARWRSEQRGTFVNSRPTVEAIDFVLVARDANGWRIDATSVLADPPDVATKEVSGSGTQSYTLDGPVVPSSSVVLSTVVTGPSDAHDPHSPLSTVRTEDAIAVRALK